MSLNWGTGVLGLQDEEAAPSEALQALRAWVSLFCIFYDFDFSGRDRRTNIDLERFEALEQHASFLRDVVEDRSISSPENTTMFVHFLGQCRFKWNVILRGTPSHDSISPSRCWI